MIQVTAIVGAVTLFIGLYTGYQYATGQAAKDQVQAVSEAKEKWTADFKQKEKVVIKYITKKGKAEVVYRDRIKTVTKYVETHDNRECFNPTELLIYTNNLKGKGTDSSSSPGGVRAITNSGGRNGYEPAT